MEKKTLEKKLYKAKKKIKDLEFRLSRCIELDAQMQDFVFENAPGGMAIISLDGEVLISNREGAEILGYSPESILGRNTTEFYTDLNNKAYLGGLLRKGESVRNFEVSVKNKYGRKLWLSLSASPFSYKGQSSILVSFSNITALKKAEEELLCKRDELELKVHERTESLSKLNEELQEREELFRAFFENRHTVILVIDPVDGAIVDANPTAINYYGYPGHILKNMNISEINDFQPEKVKALMDKACREKRKCYEFRHRLASGERRDVEVYTGPVTIGGKEHLLSVIHDITDRKRAEEQLRRYELLIASTPDFISLVDRDCFYHMVNDAYLDFFGKKRGEIIGRHMSDLLGEEHFQKVSKPNIDRAFAGENSHVETVLDLPGRGKSYFSVTYHPVRNLDGPIEFVALNARNITDLKKSLEAIKQVSDRLALATNAGRIGIWERDTETGKLVWDHMMMELYRVMPEEFTGEYDMWRSRVHPDDLEEAETVFARAIALRETVSTKFRIVWPDGQIRFIKASAVGRFDHDNGGIRIIGVNQDITERDCMEKELRRLATTDPLTGAYNRRYFMERAEEEFERAQRYTTPISILYLDIDFFKKVNDTYGHHIGDEVLKDLVQLCRTVLRTTDIFARIGGEEFAAVLVQTGIRSAKNTAERLRKAVEEHLCDIEGKKISYTISVGVSEVGDDEETIENAMIRADRALYAAKSAGRNRVESS